MSFRLTVGSAVCSWITDYRGHFQAEKDIDAYLGPEYDADEDGLGGNDAADAFRYLGDEKAGGCTTEVESVVKKDGQGCTRWEP